MRRRDQTDSMPANPAAGGTNRRGKQNAYGWHEEGQSGVLVKSREDGWTCQTYA
jgi:hypothetical protein